MSKYLSMLDDPSLKRTKQCNKYDDLLKEKEKNLKLFNIEKLQGSELKSKLMKYCLEKPVCVTKDSNEIGLKLAGF
jgi:hypothetical protein